MENRGNRLKREEIVDPRWIKFSARYLETGNAYQSAVDAGFANSFALVIQQRVPDPVIKSLKEALERKGITTDKIAEKVNVLLEATRENNQPDYQAIDKGISHAVKIRGDVIDPVEKNPTTNYNFIFSGPVQDKIKIIDAEIKDMLTNDQKD